MMRSGDEGVIERNLARVRARLEGAAARSGRAGDAVTLVAVSKTRPPEEVVAAYRAGVRHFGENRLEEGRAKIPIVAAALGDESPTWHMVGHVQSRKARDVAVTFDMVHSVDSVKVARRLGRFADGAGRCLPILLECNVSGEGAKYGFAAAHWRTDGAQQAALFASVAEILSLTGIRVEGLMTMAPVVRHPEDARPVFVALRELREELRTRFPDVPWRHLSMGMTDDFETAVEEGATMVRVGRAVFGDRIE
jgi:pyridoxal phosphate enzyme (YggS family)